MAAAARARATEVEPPPVIIVKRVAGDEHGEVHHGGAWKIAYADFVTAMMAFFMLLWIVGATNEAQRKGIADYFSPTLVKVTSSSSGSDGVLHGRSIRDDQGGAPAPASGTAGAIVNLVPRAALSPAQAAAREAAAALDRAALRRVAQELDRRLAADPGLADLRRQVRFTETREGLRIEIIDRAGFSMFELATDRLAPRAARLMREVARSVVSLPNPIAVRGHTDSLRYADKSMNNWKLSTARAEATRVAFGAAGVDEGRFARVEGVADREPFIATAPTDARNRRITVTLFYRAG